MAKVDIVVPCYNYGRFLRGCVSSILRQSMGDLRVLIIDDASSDESLSLARALAEEDSRVSVVSHAENRGHIRTYNEGLDWVAADYCMLLSADDVLVAGALERAVSVLDAFPDVVLTYGGWIQWDGSPPLPDPGEQEPTWIRQDGLEFIKACCSSAENFVRTPTVVARSSAQKSIGGYSESLPHSGDMEMWLRFAANGAVCRMNAVQAIYRQHTSNMSNSYSLDYAERKAAFDRFFSEYATRLPDCEKMREQAIRALAERAFWTGTAQLCRGNVEAGRRLVSFATTLCPELRYRPPLMRIARTPDLHERVPRVFEEVIGSLLRRAGEKLGVVKAAANGSTERSAGLDQQHRD